mgnify:FL=1|tara:strand:- start:394 stop:732 length:339 start_codon:yes stop_codon:yes gene_type:complete
MEKENKIVDNKGAKPVADTTKKVNIELEVDTNVVDSSKNKYQGLIDLAKAVDSWRIFPRIFITTYIFLLYKVVIWYMDLAAPTMEQSGLVSIVVGAGAAWFGLYTGSRSGKK